VCPIESQSCLYATASCRCSNGAWTCTACPDFRPNVSPIPPGTSAPLCINEACSYGDVTCSCSGTNGWACGVCPAARPAEGTACGNVSFACTYGNDVCGCTGDQGWSCQTLTCPAHPTAPGPSQGRENCPGSSGSLSYTCVYPNEQQVCTCAGGFMTCLCPTAQPTDGANCVGTPSCSYGGQSCLCSQGHWNCSGACPAIAPTAGSACDTPLTCAYPLNGGPTLCVCDGATWSCPA